MSTAFLVIGLVVTTTGMFVALFAAVRESLKVRRTRQALRRMNISMSKRHWYVPE